MDGHCRRFGGGTGSGLQASSVAWGPRRKAGALPLARRTDLRDFPAMDPRIEAWSSRGDHMYIGGRRIFWWEQGSGPPLLALHGFPASSYDWRYIANLLPGFRFIAFDLPGFGLSDKDPNADYSLEGHATVAERLLENLGVESCDVVAHDMGIPWRPS